MGFVLFVHFPTKLARKHNPRETLLIQPCFWRKDVTTGKLCPCGWTLHSTQDCVLPACGLLMALVTLSPASSMVGAHQHLLNKLLAERCRWKNPFSAVLSTSQRPRNRTQ